MAADSLQRRLCSRHSNSVKFNSLHQHSGVELLPFSVLNLLRGRQRTIAIIKGLNYIEVTSLLARTIMFYGRYTFIL